MNRGYRTRDSYDKNFQCTYKDCDKMFYRKYHLFRHQRLKHWAPFVKDNYSSTENAVHGSSENISTSEPVSQPVQSEYSFPAESLGSSGNLETTEQLNASSDEVESEEKRKISSSFGDDLLELSADNDEWMESGQIESSEPVAGFSQWADDDEEPQHDTIVSMFRCRDLLHFGPTGIKGTVSLPSGKH